jgi:hypothetical protein
LDRELYEEIRKAAQERGVPMSVVIRERLRGSRSEHIPVDPGEVKALVIDLLTKDAEVAQALQSKA